ncbi:hypothetical protein D5086_000256 [Populus alba]|uniref:Uncharacterized protein n=1 Tax=Populus alba TaxID=43335 RepID=A0ACC4CVB6_POPAL
MNRKQGREFTQRRSSYACLPEIMQALSHLSVNCSRCQVVIATISVGFCYGCSSAGCRLSEKGALLKFKNDLTGSSNRLASGVSDEDCCRWSGVVCNNLTGHVLELYLGTHISYDVN